jgi:putative ABC transport system permease protein
VIAALGTALVTGLLFGALPAKRAAALDPVTALARR